jgi:hypothetical protein
MTLRLAGGAVQSAQSATGSLGHGAPVGADGRSVLFVCSSGRLLVCHLICWRQPNHRRRVAFAPGALHGGDHQSLGSGFPLGVLRQVVGRPSQHRTHALLPAPPDAVETSCPKAPDCRDPDHDLARDSGRLTDDLELLRVWGLGHNQGGPGVIPHCPGLLCLAAPPAHRLPACTVVSVALIARGAASARLGRAPAAP